MRRDLLAFALLAAGLVWVALVLYLAPKGCSPENAAAVAAVLGVFVGPVLFAAATFLLAASRSTSRWVPWTTALVTVVLGALTLSSWTYVTLVDKCTA